uniref:Uncharacterized protein n=1 Tax=Panagrolaimus davidi TaxID=227884 RepID=A0A914QL60_9BILA
MFFVILDYGFAKLRTEKDEKLDKLRMTPSTFDKMKNLHKNTYYTAVKAIIGKMGSILYKELPKTEKRLLARCLDKIEDRRELINSAKCVVIARKRFLKIKSEMTKNYLKFTTPSPISKNGNGWKAFLQQFDDFDRLHSFSSTNLQTPANFTFIPKKQRNGFFKEKEETRRFQPRKFKKINYDYPFMQNTQKAESNPFQMQSYKPLSIKKFTNHKKLKRMQASMLERKLYGRDLNPLQSNIKPMQQRRRGYNRLQLLGKKIKVLSRMNSANAAISRRMKEKPISRRFMKFMHRAKRSIFSDSKDHYYKEKRFKTPF